MNLEETALHNTVHVRVCCKDWEMVRSTVRFPMESSGEEQHETLGCVVDFPALSHDQWHFLQPELDRLGIVYDYLDHTGPDAQWISRLTSCG